jgi:CHAD domain-containing protein
MSDEHDGEIQLSHLRELLGKRLHQLAHSERFAEAEDPVGALHDLRVSVRRLRAFGDVFRGLLGEKAHARTNEPLKRVIRAVTEVRDRDVQIALTEERRQASQAEFDRATLEYVLERLGEARALAMRRAARKLRKTDFDSLGSSIRATFDNAIETFPTRAASQRLFAKDLLLRLVEKAGAIGPLGAGEDPARVHRLRIAVKKLRYAFELFQPSLGESYQPLTERATALQDFLGDHHDRVVFGAFADQIVRELEAKKRSALAMGTRSLRASLAKEQEDLAARLDESPFDAALWREQVRRGTSAD